MKSRNPNQQEVLQMDVYEAIETRQSIRRYRPDPVPDEVLNRVLDAMRLAPSAGNLQPWRFIVVTDAAVIEQLAQATDRQQWIAHAPVIIAACGWEDRAYPRWAATGTASRWT